MSNQPQGVMIVKPLVHTLLALAVLLPLCLQAGAPASAADPEESQRMAAIQRLGLESIQGSMPTYYSPHAAARARYLQKLLGGEIAYFTDQFQFPFHPVTIAVLNSAQWPKVAGAEPYGMPSVEGTQPAVVVMPASWDGVSWMVFPKRTQVPPDMLRKALAGGKRWHQIRFEGGDGIGTHEIGHYIIRQLGIDPQTNWFNEFLASYAGYAYLKAQRPDQVLSNEIFWAVGLQHSPHPFTMLDDFENRYEELQEKYPGNYGWYQLALDQRVIEVYRQEGLDYLRTIRAQFAAGGAKLDSAQVLDKLERITPGWQTWASRLQAGAMSAVASR
jgi:hypothetical protein